MKTKFLLITAMALLLTLLVVPQSFMQTNEAPESMTGIKVGETAPAFALNDQTGTERSLESLLAMDGTTVLIFYRSADW